MLKLIRACIGCETPDDLWLNQEMPLTQFDIDDGENIFAKRARASSIAKAKR